MSKNFRFFLISLFCCFCGMGAQLVAQSQTNFVPGHLFVKVQNDAGIILPEIRQQADVVLLEKQGFLQLHSLFEDFEVYHLERAYRGLKNEDLENTYLLKFRQKGFEWELADRIMASAFIEYAEAEPIYATTLIPNDYIASNQWYLGKINATAAWDVTTGSENVSIGIVDQGFLTTHPDLAANIWTNPGEIPGNGIDDDGNGYIDDVNGWDAANGDGNPNPPAQFSGYFDHGTAVSGCASPVTNNNVGIAGLGYNCSIVPIKSKTDASAANTSQTDEQRRLLDATFPGITYAVRAKLDVVNMSFGGPGFSQTVQNMITAGHDLGVTFIAAAGNDNDASAFYPASYDHVINVGSTNSSDRKSGFSNYGTTVDIMAPGSSIRTTDHNAALNPSYTTSQGTSLSSPIVAGLAGLLKSINPCLTPDEIAFYIQSTAVDISSLNPSYIGQLGAGRIDAAAAVNAAKPSLAPVASFTYDSTSICDGSIEFFYDGQTDACPNNIFWSFNGQSSTAINPVFTVTDTGAFMVTLVVNNAIGTDMVSQTIQINKVLLVDAGGDDRGVITACVGETVVLNASSNAVGGSARWNPTIGINNANLLNPTIGAITNRTYSLTVTDPSGCQVTDEVELLIVHSVDAGLDQSINLGDTAQLEVSVVGSGYTYEWTPAASLNDPSLKNPQATPDRNTLYSVKATAFSGCELTDEVEVQVKGGVGMEDKFNEIAAIHAAYPNPAKGEMYLSAQLKQASTLRVTAYDLTGREVATLYDQQAPAAELRFSWQQNALPAGMYLLVWQTADAQQVQKVEWK